MIFTDIIMPDGKKRFFFLDETAKSKEVIKELKAEYGEIGGETFLLFEDRTGRILDEKETLLAQKITSGCRLRLARNAALSAG